MDPYSRSQAPVPPNLPTGDFPPPQGVPPQAPTPVPRRVVQAPRSPVPPAYSVAQSGVGMQTSTGVSVSQVQVAPQNPPAPPRPQPQIPQQRPQVATPPPPPVQPPQTTLRPPTYQPLTSVPGYTPPIRAAYPQSGDLQLEANPPSALPVPKQVSMKTAVTAIVSSLALVVLGGSTYLYFTVLRPSPNLQESLYIPPAPRVQDTASIGGDIYDGVTNPVGAALPESESPVENPLEGAYQNPFQ